MKNKTALFLTILLFLIENTRYFWEEEFATVTLLIYLFLSLLYICLIGLIIYFFITSIFEKFKNKHTNWTLGIMAFVLALNFFKPYGLIEDEQFESKNLLIAQRESDANCRTIIKLKANNNFVEEVSCFGIKQTEGEYTIKNDTIFFSNINSVS